MAPCRLRCRVSLKDPRLRLAKANHETVAFPRILTCRSD